MFHSFFFFFTTFHTNLFFLASDGVECVLRSKQQSTLPPLLLLLFIISPLPLQLLLTVRIKLPNVVLDINMSHSNKNKNKKCDGKKAQHLIMGRTRTSSNFLASCRRFRQYLIQHLAMSALCCLSFSLRSLSISPASGSKTKGCQAKNNKKRK